MMTSTLPSPKGPGPRVVAVLGGVVLSGTLGAQPAFAQIAPALTVLSPADGGLVGGTVPVEARASSGLGIRSVTFGVDGGLPRALTLDAVSGTFKGTWDSAGVADGAHTMTVTALDTVGLITVKQLRVTVDNTAACTCFTSQTLDQVFAILPPSRDPTKIRFLRVDDPGFTTFDYFDGSLISPDGSFTGLTGSSTGTDSSLHALSIYIDVTHRTAARPARCVVDTTPAIDILPEFTGAITDAEANACRAALLGSQIWNALVTLAGN